MTATLTRSRLTVTEILNAARPSRIWTELTGTAEYGVRLTWADEDGLEERTYYGTKGPWDREHAEGQLAAGRRYQERNGIAPDVHLVSRYQGSAWARCIA